MDNARQSEVQRTQTQYGHDVAGEYKERIISDGKDRQGLNRSQRSNHELSIMISAKASGVRARLPLTRTASCSPTRRSGVTGSSRLANVMTWLLLGVRCVPCHKPFSPHLRSKRPRTRRGSNENAGLTQHRPRNHHGAHHECPYDAPEQHSMLIQHGNLEVRKNDRDNEDVIHAERFFDHIPCEEQNCCFPSVWLGLL